jgi:hypothetical protein
VGSCRPRLRAVLAGFLLASIGVPVLLGTSKLTLFALDLPYNANSNKAVTRKLSRPWSQKNEDVL